MHWLNGPTISEYINNTYESMTTSEWDKANMEATRTAKPSEPNSCSRNTPFHNRL